MKQKIFTILIMLVLLLNIFSYSYATMFDTDEWLELEIEHQRWHREQELFQKKQVYIDRTFIILIGIMIFIFSIISKYTQYNRTKLIYAIAFIVLSISWFISFGILVSFEQIADLYFSEAWIGLFILLELILMLINYIYNKNKINIMSAILMAFIGSIVLVIFNEQIIVPQDWIIVRWINVLISVNLAMIPMYILNKKRRTDENIRN